MNEGFTNAPACAACKQQRKRCDETCLLAPYFPASRYQDYLSAHKLFGLSNIQRIMSSVEPNRRQITADTLMIEGNVWANDPIGGCLADARKIHTQIEYTLKELAFVNQHLSFFREREKQMQQQKMQLQNFLTTPSLSLIPLALPNSGSEAFHTGDTKSALEHGYHYQSTLEEGVDVKPFDILPIDQLMEHYQYEHALTSFRELGESSSSKALGKKPMEYYACDDEETENEDGSPEKGEEHMDVKKE